MQCPCCGYEPQINENDWCAAPGRFFALGVEAKQEGNFNWGGPIEVDREEVFGCPRCGVMFMNRGYEPPIV